MCIDRQTHQMYNLHAMMVDNDTQVHKIIINTMCPPGWQVKIWVMPWPEYRIIRAMSCKNRPRIFVVVTPKEGWHKPIQAFFWYDTDYKMESMKTTGHTNWWSVSYQKKACLCCRQPTLLLVWQRQRSLGQFLDDAPQMEPSAHILIKVLLHADKF